MPTLSAWRFLDSWTDRLLSTGPQEPMRGVLGKHNVGGDGKAICGYAYIAQMSIIAIIQQWCLR